MRFPELEPPAVNTPFVQGVATPPAAEEKNDDPRVVKIDLVEPITVKGREVAELVLDFRKLRPRALRNIEEEIRESGETVMPSPFFSATYCQYLGARAAGLSLDDFDNLEYEDVLQVTQAVQNFSARSAARSQRK